MWLLSFCLIAITISLSSFAGTPQAVVAVFVPPSICNATKYVEDDVRDYCDFIRVMESGRDLPVPCSSKKRQDEVG